MIQYKYGRYSLVPAKGGEGVGYCGEPGTLWHLRISWPLELGYLNNKSDRDFITPLSKTYVRCAAVSCVWRTHLPITSSSFWRFCCPLTVSSCAIVDLIQSVRYNCHYVLYNNIHTQQHLQV